MRNYLVYWTNRPTSQVLKNCKSPQNAREKAKKLNKGNYGSITRVIPTNVRENTIIRAGKWKNNVPPGLKVNKRS